VRNAMQFKAIIKNVAKEKRIYPQSVLNIYVLELFLDRLSQSKYRRYFIVKGGFLISSMVGIEARSTMDIDLTIKNYPLNADILTSIFKDVCSIKVSDDFIFSFSSINKIREQDEYDGYRVCLIATYETLSIPVKFDITTGDILTPSEITYSYKRILGEGYINIFSYNTETIIAEKLETILSRNVLNTRARDFYDVWILGHMYEKFIDYSLLGLALTRTAERRGSKDAIIKYSETLEAIKGSDIMNDRWIMYQNKFVYAKNISFIDCVEFISSLMEKIIKYVFVNVN